ncbi:MAG: AEC family transporter, partial [Halobacteria archaeon]|nr:AEC family transporter [Halobacteria archaeon]
SGAFPNTANYGIPLSVFAFPEVGRTTAVLYVIGSSVMIYTVGIYIASDDSSLRRVFELPLIYAVVLAAAVNFAGISLPSSQMK